LGGKPPESFFKKGFMMAKEKEEKKKLTADEYQAQRYKDRCKS